MFRLHQNAFAVVVVATLSVAQVGCSGTAADPARSTAIEALTGDLTNGKRLYEPTCTTCHGADGKSGSEKKNIAADAASNKSKAIEQVLSGGGSMPAYADQYTDQEIADIVAYTASLK